MDWVGAPRWCSQITVSPLRGGLECSSQIFEHWKSKVWKRFMEFAKCFFFFFNLSKKLFMCSTEVLMWRLFTLPFHFLCSSSSVAHCNNSNSCLWRRLKYSSVSFMKKNKTKKIQNISQTVTLIQICQVVRYQSDYLFHFQVVASTSSTSYYSHVHVRCLLTTKLAEPCDHLMETLNLHFFGKPFKTSAWH